MLAADTALQVGTNSTSFLCSHTDELTYTVLVEYLEGIDLQNLLLQIYGEEGSNVIARIAEGHLRQVVRTEGEELGRRGDAVGRQSSTRHLNLLWRQADIKASITINPES